MHITKCGDARLLKFEANADAGTQFMLGSTLLPTRGGALKQAWRPQRGMHLVRIGIFAGAVVVLG